MTVVSSAFWLALQGDSPNICEMIELSTVNGTYRWCVSDAPRVSSGQTYDPFPGGASRGAEESTTLKIGTINFTVANTGDLPKILKSNALKGAEVYVFRVFVDTPDLGRLPVFRGQLGDITANRLAITGEARNLFQGIASRFPYYTIQDTCNWKFGGVGCGINTSSVTVGSVGVNVASSTAIFLRATGSALVNSYAPGQLERGRVTMLTGPNSGAVRSVRVNSGDMVFLSHSLPFPVQSGDCFSIYPGCRKRLIDDCTSKFNNSGRFLGAPWIPKQEQAY